jgi:hypothetical protein
MFVRCFVASACLFTASVASAQVQAPPVSALARLPVKEVTVFKDGHAYVLHEGKAPVDADGEVRMDYLPTPILGTFWAYSAEDGKPLKKMTASRRRVRVERTAMTVTEMIQANVGAEATLREKSGRTHEGKIVGIPTRTVEELEATDPPNTEPRLPERAWVVLIATNTGVAAVPLEAVDQVTFRKEPAPKMAGEEFRNLLSLSIPGAVKGATASVGLMYVQKGLRWIPSYQVSLDGKGTARVRMQATIVNELLDLKDATVHLVIGVPSFAFENTPDPMSLQLAFAQLSSYFDKSTRSGRVLSNALGGQVARMGERFDAGAPVGPGDIPEIEGQGKAEDLFVYKVGNVTLSKGARMVMPVAEFTLPYKDLYTLEFPYAPPAEARANAGRDQQADTALAASDPRVEHRIRFTNTSASPLTTAPALVLSEGRVIAQGMMTYAAPKATTDLTLTAAVDIRAKRAEKETDRKPNAIQIASDSYGRTDLAGTITLTNYADKAVTVEVTRYIVGHVDRAENGGSATNLDPYSEDAMGVHDPLLRWYPWPGWWRQANGLGRFQWTVAIPAGKSADLAYTWHYFWR